MPVVTGNMTKPDLTDQGPGGSGRIELVDSSGNPTSGLVTATGETIFGMISVGVDYSVTLTGNAALSPANTRYRRTWLANDGTTSSATFIVPTGGGPYTETSLISLPPLPVQAVSTTVRPNLRSSPAPVWTEQVYTTDAGGLDSIALTFEHGQAVMRGLSGSAARSGRRSVFLLPSTPGGYSRMISRWSGQPYVVGKNPQRGHMHGTGIQADGKRRGGIVWHDIVFDAPHVFNLGVWEANADGTGFVASSLSSADSAAVSAGSRTTNVVTLTVPTGHGFAAGDGVDVDVTNAAFDGTFQLTSVTATTVVYGQTAANDPTAGTGTISLSRAGNTKNDLIRVATATDAVRTNGLVTATVPAGHPFQVGDWVAVDAVDNTYDGQFVVTERPAGGTTIRWRQAVADDASAGVTTLTKVLPYWVESEWRPGQLRARVWPDMGLSPTAGPVASGAPPWESAFAMAVNLNSVTNPDPQYGQGCALVAAHLSANTVTEVRYDSITCESISV